MLIFDELKFIAQFLFESKCDLFYLFEISQFPSKILQRLYLTILVGSVLQKTSSFDCLNEMLEMCKGIQQPTKGLFLRYYLIGIICFFIINRHQ